MATFDWTRIQALPLHKVTGHNYGIPIEIRQPRFNHNNLPLQIPSRLLISSRTRSNSHAYFQNVINSISSMVDIFFDFFY